METNKYTVRGAATQSDVEAGQSIEVEGFDTMAEANAFARKIMSYEYSKAEKVYIGYAVIYRGDKIVRDMFY